MEHQLERRILLNAEPKHKSLYPWAINEIDENGALVDGDQIPWDWTLWFTATSCTLNDSIELESEWQSTDGTEKIQPSTSQRQVINIKLRSGHPIDDDHFLRKTSYSMFGTSRTISDFRLDIYPIANSGKSESCTALGSPSYTTDSEYGLTATEDWIIFNLFVSDEVFNRYIKYILNNSIHQITFSAKSVDGFYSEWSPSISTRDVKVLTQGKAQNIEIPEGFNLKPRRLGAIGETGLCFNHNIDLPKNYPDRKIMDDNNNCDTNNIEKEIRTTNSISESEIIKTLTSLKRAIWWIVALVAFNFLTIMLN